MDTPGPAVVRWLIVALLLGVWLAGLVVIRLNLWIPWTAFFLALGYAMAGGSSSPPGGPSEPTARSRL